MKRRYSVSTAASTPPKMAIGIIGSMIQLIPECLAQITERENRIQFDSRTFSSQKKNGMEKESGKEKRWLKSGTLERRILSKVRRGYSYYFICHGRKIRGCDMVVSKCSRVDSPAPVAG
jgi:hypothetical protein